MVQMDDPRASKVRFTVEARFLLQTNKIILSKCLFVLLRRFTLLPGGLNGFRQINWNDLLYSLIRFRDIFAFSSGRSFILVKQAVIPRGGQTQWEIIFSLSVEYVTVNNK